MSATAVTRLTTPPQTADRVTHAADNRVTQHSRAPRFHARHTRCCFTAAMSHGFGGLTPELFVGFRADLDQGAWKGVAPLAKGEDPLDAPAVTYWKCLLIAGIDDLVVAQEAANDVSEYDTPWDQAERRFVFAVQLKTVDRDPSVARDALAVQAALCPGGGTGMTTLGYDQEVDYARNQLSIAARPAMAKRLKRLKLDDEIEDIRTCTENLARAIGRSGDEDSTAHVARSKRVRQATRACAAAFNHVYDALSLARGRAGDTTRRAHIEALVAPLERLLERRPSRDAADDTTDDTTDDAKPLAPTG